MAATATPAATEQTPKTPLLEPELGPPDIEGFNIYPKIKDETFKEKFIRKTKENPFVPIGCLATAGALIFGLRSFQQGKTKQSQILMRGRIAAQGFTIVALLVGVVGTALKSK
ncbi:HIG1 domain family member 2A, mitochondrial [Toxotes jaculatrix]|uniref:HIG1 domain family member 2A, mitochondrial n=1 Tax=Toxotes jaculatrix TaxID=941984 RepID=UPI001B3AC646|nr:HIG1 domain family member 2A, mitochondrial [Toxotes jaculatrix]